MTLLIHSYDKANDAVARHWKYFKNTQCRLVGVDTEPGGCIWPEHVKTIKAGDGFYMQGANLCRRLVQTMEWCLADDDDWNWIIAEYDVLILNPDYLWTLPFTNENPLGTVWCHLTGSKPWDAKANWFSHSPWHMNTAAIRTLLPVMRDIIGEGHCEYGKADSSPDVFWGYACERSGVTVNHNCWRQFTRNSLDCEGDLEAARKAIWEERVDVIHGCKTAKEFQYLGL